MMLALKSGHQIAAKVGNPAGLLCRRIWYSVGKSGVLGIMEYRQGRPLFGFRDFRQCFRASRSVDTLCKHRGSGGSLFSILIPSTRGDQRGS